VLVKAKKGDKEDLAVANRLQIYELFSQILGELCSQRYVCSVYCVVCVVRPVPDRGQRAAGSERS
jgi:hypothetical protein